MLAHHFFYAHLDGKAVDSPLFEFRGFGFWDQSVSSVLGNAIAYAARTVLSAGTGIVFIQVLWSKLRREQYSVKQLDALVACKGDPLALSALPAWHCAFWLAVIAAMASLMAVISIITPGSLRVESSQYSFPQECSIRTVSLGTSNIASTVANVNSSDGVMFLGAQAKLMALAHQVLMGGAAIQLPNPCPPGSACRYEIDFNAPAAVCNPFDSSFNYTSWLPPPDNDTAPIRVWESDTNVLWTTFTVGAWSTVARRDLATNAQSAVNCTMFNATHHAIITHSNISTSSVEVYRTDIHDEFPTLIISTSGPPSPQEYTEMQFAAIITAFCDVLFGEVSYDPGTQEYSADADLNLQVAYSALFSSSNSSDVPWASTVDLSSVLPSLMRNITVSLLAEQLSTNDNPSTAPSNTTCWYSSSVYRYNRVRLLSTYGAALGIAATCMLFGFRAIYLNGVEESNAFSRIIEAVLNKSLFNDRFELSMSSKLTANGSPDGQLALAHSTNDPS